jgi:hypothetical protein
MFAKLRRLMRLSFIPCILSLAPLLCIPVPSRAETSYHQLKRKLRKVEKKTGKVMGVAGEIAGKAAVGTMSFGLEIILNSLEDEDSPDCDHEHRLLPDHGKKADNHGHQAPKSHPASSKEHSK